MKTISKMSISALLVFGLMLFLPAWTFDYWQAWVFLLVFFALSTWIPGIYLMRNNPAALQRRIRASPTAETRPVQKVVKIVQKVILRSYFIPTGGE